MSGITVILTVIVGFTVTAILGTVMIPFLRKLKYGQTIREDGPTWHKQKQGTPTMGGMMFIVGTVVAAVVGFSYLVFVQKSVLLETKGIVRLLAGLIMALLFGMIGFFDDYIKVVKKQNLGLKAKQKLMLQILVTVFYLTILYAFGDRSTIVNLPFLGQWQFGVLYYPIMGILIIGIVNSVNLTDGIDGLAGCVTFIVAVFFMAATAVLKLSAINVLASALAASLLGFLIYNIHPAKVFMGDTGSLFLGGMVVALAFGVNMPFILFFVGFMYCVESLSVILQVISFQTTGKRIFRMSPIHHHFEMGGMSESKIVTMFCLITIVMSVLSYFAIINM
ncbi:phospho-N-acetylmuramoyl-pentapeptide-transferase [Paludicola sp. MB14-C6]|uniref:phospho-N-acetylmuramoyl-pentapeptide- transferase n=1 Tax=Paludihabitans sp. MB14-C6 TaxID=3070656 RepID=UPI0027DE00A2|nr:phospho-N-acetylmuramoyl-pentapeptide-transferase [Paludicola sp. MB14-C6]WMJ23762.1 phospho-N-acetylmuramoyl-pentapeptide-transferase [Paludicola sp. MB14-C6]